jgi:hypothetical protein
LPPSKAELDNLRSIVARSLSDAAAANLSADAQFVMAYDAARTLSRMIVRAEGYRPRSAGGHYNTFIALEAADPSFAKLSSTAAGSSATSANTYLPAASAILTRRGCLQLRNALLSTARSG